MTLPGIDVASFQGEPGEWRQHAGDIAWAAVKLTQVFPNGRVYTDPDARDDWAFLKANRLGRVAYLYGMPSTSVRATVRAFVAELTNLGLEDPDGVALDLEETDGLPPGQVAAYASGVLSLLRSTLNRRPLFYSYISFIESGNAAGCGRYLLWLADPSDPAGHPHVPVGPFTECAIQQDAAESGIDRDVAFYRSLADFQHAIGKIGPVPPPHPTPAPAPSPTPDPNPAPPPAVPDWQEDALKALSTVKTGDKGPAVRTAQGLLVARGHNLGTTGAAKDGVDGDFGSLTDTAVRDEQVKAGFTGAEVNGVVDEKTWPVLLDVA